tara:strand:+ start:549 stop:1628 length:1080 start_codon:yes stop_codon:yes gene_type:complete
MNHIVRSLVALSVIITAAIAQVPGKAGERVGATKEPPFAIIESYPLSTCVVTGKPVEAGKHKSTKIEGRTYITCCEKCVEKITAKPNEFRAKLDAAVIASEAPGYPLTTCPVSGKALGSMGKPTQVVLDGHLVQLCCSGCTKKATADKLAIISKVRLAAYTAQKAAYPLETCPISREKLVDGEAIDVMLGMTLVRLGCENCLEQLEENSVEVLAHLAEVAVVRRMLGAYEVIRGLLVRDQLATAIKHADDLEKLAKAAMSSGPERLKQPMSMLASAATTLKNADPGDGNAVRRAFGESGRVLVDLLSKNSSMRKGYFVFDCPMAQGYRKWVQPSDQIANPYMGQSMPKCGSKSMWEEGK